MVRERVITGEAVELELPVARLGTRTVAALVDAIVQLSLLGIMSVAAAYMLDVYGADDALAAAVYVALTVLVLLIWPVTFETVTRGRSPGKYTMGLRVVRDDGGPVRFRHALTRGLVGLVIECPGLLAPPLTWTLGSWTMLLNGKGKRIGDIAAGTMVLQERLPARGRYVAVMPPPLATWASGLDLTRVSDDLALTTRQFLSRAHELRDGPRTAIGQRLVDEFAAVTTPPPPPNTPGWWYLAAIIAERRNRHEERLRHQRQLAAATPGSHTAHFQPSAQPSYSAGAPAYATPHAAAPGAPVAVASTPGGIAAGGIAAPAAAHEHPAAAPSAAKSGYLPPA